MRTAPRFLLAVTLFATTSCSLWQPIADSEWRTEVPDGINDRFLDPALDPDEWLNRWEVESREIYTSRHAILAAVGLKAGDRVADIGAGTGLFVAPFAQSVSAAGKVYALEISPGFVSHLRDRVAREQLANVEVILSQEASTTLPPASVDVVFLCDTYHHFEHYRKMLASIRQTLRPGGQVVVIDFERIPGVSREWILGHVRAGKPQVIDEFTAAGFVLTAEISVAGLEENYCLRFTRP
ncbi:MAG: methyltransferase domain-containing protein [Planctomycetota bacterium]